MPSGQNLLITGSPGVGKTSAVLAVGSSLEKLSIQGFYTREIRAAGKRRGFRVTSFDGRDGRLAHVDCDSPYRVSRYGIDLESFERVALPSLEAREDVDLYVVDEIGKMECFSTRFVDAMRRLLDSGRTVIATISQRGGGFIAEVKRRSDVDIWTVTAQSRAAIPKRIAAWITEARAGLRDGLAGPP